jgi:hypothetical protein
VNHLAVPSHHLFNIASANQILEVDCQLQLHHHSVVALALASIEGQMDVWSP